MGFYDIHGYIDMLKFSILELRKLESERNIRLEKELSGEQQKREQIYHVFSFSQILYALKHHLKILHEDDRSKIEEFFKLEKRKEETPVRVVSYYANKWKHNFPIHYQQNFSFDPSRKVKQEEKEVEFAGEKFMATVMSINKVNLNIPPKESVKDQYEVNELLEKCLEDLEKFISSLD